MDRANASPARPTPGDAAAPIELAAVSHTHYALVLKALRLERGLTRAALAEHAGVPEPRVYAAEMAGPMDQETTRALLFGLEFVRALPKQEAEIYRELGGLNGGPPSAGKLLYRESIPRAIPAGGFLIELSPHGPGTWQWIAYVRPGEGGKAIDDTIYAACQHAAEFCEREFKIERDLAARGRADSAMGRRARAAYSPAPAAETQIQEVG